MNNQKILERLCRANSKIRQKLQEKLEELDRNANGLSLGDLKQFLTDKI